jgi:hypothetical protein
VSARHWIRFDGRGWYVPHGRITLDKGTSDLSTVTCLLCLRHAERHIMSMQGSLNAARINRVTEDPRYVARRRPAPKEK